MDPENSLQDVTRCHLCETPVPPLHCVICNIHLCKDCEGKHLSDKSKQHKVVPFKYRGAFPKCQKHSTKICARYCEECNIPVCEFCLSSDNHQTHDEHVLDILKSLENKKRVLKGDLEELGNIYPEYQELESQISAQRADFNENSKKMTIALNKHGEELHREIDTIIKELKIDLEKMNSEHLAVLKKRQYGIKLTISEITRNIADLNKLLNSNDINLLSAYKSKIAEFKIVPSKIKHSFPKFTPKMINKRELYQQFGSLSGSSIKIGEHDYMPLFAIPEIVTEFNTNYGNSVACSGDGLIWVCSDYDKMSLYNSQGEVVDAIETKSGFRPQFITVTKSGDLVYSDGRDKTVNIVKNSQINTVIKLRRWKPRSVCSTFSGDLLVVMVRDDEDKKTKVVRYAGSTKKQSIQFNDKGQPLYSSGRYTKYISENRNLDICVSDSGANAVVVVNHAGKLRFTYTGPPSTTKGSFSPRGIITDSQSRILIADSETHSIHILDKEGRFLRYIDNCHLQGPYGLCVDTRDNLFVAESLTGKVKKINYCGLNNICRLPTSLM